MNDKFLQNHVDIPTRQNNILDLILSNCPEYFGSVTTEVNQKFSDHEFLIDIEKVSMEKGDINLYSTCLPKLKWRDSDPAQWEKYSENINLDQWSDICDKNMTVNDKVNLLIDKIQQAAEEVFEPCAESKHPTIPKHIRKLFKKKSRYQIKLKKLDLL